MHFAQRIGMIQLIMQDDFVTPVERDLLEHIIAGLRSRNLSVDQAEQLARDFLVALPATDKEDLLNKLNVLGKTYKAAQETYVDFVGSHEKQKKEELLNQMRSHIQSGNIEAAIALAKGEK